jgi:hypothetical protein
MVTKTRGGYIYRCLRRHLLKREARNIGTVFGIFYDYGADVSINIQFKQGVLSRSRDFAISAALNSMCSVSVS